MKFHACVLSIYGLVIIHFSFADETDLINKREWGNTFQGSDPLIWDNSVVDKRRGWGKRSPLDGIYDDESEDWIEELNRNSKDDLQNYKTFVENSINYLANDDIVKRRGWGKRSELDLNKRRGWGKRSDEEIFEMNLDKRRGWGKRSDAEVDKRRGWGKRSLDSFDIQPSEIDKRRGWGKRGELMPGDNHNGIWKKELAEMLSSDILKKRGWGKRSTNSLSSQYKQLQDKLAIQTLSCDDLKLLIRKQLLPDMAYDHCENTQLEVDSKSGK